MNREGFDAFQILADPLQLHRTASLAAVREEGFEVRHSPSDQTVAVVATALETQVMEFEEVIPIDGGRELDEGVEPMDILAAQQFLTVQVAQNEVGIQR